MLKFLFKSNEEKIKVILNKSYKSITNHIFIRIDNIDFEFYVIPESEYDSNLIKDIEKFSYNITYLKSGAIIQTSLGFIIISYDVTSLELICKILEEQAKITKSQYNRLHYDIDKYLSTSYLEINAIKKEFPNTIITSNGIIILKQIIPFRFIHTNILGKIPQEAAAIINSIEFVVNSENKIVSVKLDNEHPNCDRNNNYCLGDLKFLDLNLNSVNSIMKSVEVYNLKNAYFIPTSIKKYLEEHFSVVL